MKIHPQTALGPVHYTVADMERVAAFYRNVLGFQERWRGEGSIALGTASRELLRLTERPGARPARRATGLYHTAFLVPTRRDLAHLVRQIAVHRVPVHGTSDHGTHLAIYLPDPEGNGIELAWDYPREEWPMQGGKLIFSQMRRGGVDIDALFAELEREPAPWTGLPDGTVVGHVHLHVSDLKESERFYHEVLGFDVTLASAQFGAVFVSAGGYHHHIGMNVWKGVGIAPPPPGSAGLRHFTILVPEAGELDRLAQRLEASGVEARAGAEGVWIKDPAGIEVLLAVAQGD